MTDPTVQPNPNEPKPNELKPRWRPLVAIDRRVAGVLVEKAKTTPDAYPLSLNALVTGCNQKSNRHPLMELEPEDVEESLDRLRGMGAVVIVQGSGRVSRYRHLMYEWLGVEKVELSVMTELLLRGAQTEGELRARASRMDPIADLAALRAELNSLTAKGLVIALTPEGRGHVVTHALYEPREMEKLRKQYASGNYEQAESHAIGGEADDETEPAAPRTARGGQPSVPEAKAASPPSVTLQVLESFRRELDEARGQITQMRTDVDRLTDELGQARDELRRLKDSLGG
ncbi:MAG: DUF480 domain-containing protein [Pirellulales bacterium]